MKQAGGRLGFFVIEHGAAGVGVPDKRHAGEPGHDFPQELQPLAAEIRRDIGEARDIAPRTREARHEPGPDRIDTVDHHDRDRPGLSSGRRDRLVGARHDHVDLPRPQLPHKPPQSLALALAVAEFQDERLALDVAKLPHSLSECFEEHRVAGGSGTTEKTDPWNMGWLLRSDRRPEHDDGEKTGDGGDRPRTYDLTRRPTRRSLACWEHADRLTAVGHGRESVAVARTCQERRDASSLSFLDG